MQAILLTLVKVYPHQLPENVPFCVFVQLVLFIVNESSFFLYYVFIHIGMFVALAQVFFTLTCIE